MKRFSHIAFLLLSIALVATIGFAARQYHAAKAQSRDYSRAALRQIASIDLPGPAGKRFDYLTVDYDDGYLLSAHLGAGLLYVIDLKTNEVLHTIADVPGVEGVEYVPE